MGKNDVVYFYKLDIKPMISTFRKLLLNYKTFFTFCHEDLMCKQMEYSDLTIVVKKAERCRQIGLKKTNRENYIKI